MDKKVYNFLKSNLNEADYYNLTKEDLISLKEYYLLLREFDSKFKNSVHKEVNSIKEKCNWVNEISFNPVIKDSIFSGVHLLASDNINILAEKDLKTGIYNDFVTRIPKICLMFEEYRNLAKRQNDLSKIQEELAIIDQFGRKIYKNNICNVKSISNTFDILYVPCLGMSVSSDTDLITTFFDKDVFSNTKKFLLENEKKKVLSMIQIKDNKLFHEMED